MKYGITCANSQHYHHHHHHNHHHLKNMKALVVVGSGYSSLPDGFLQGKSSLVAPQEKPLVFSLMKSDSANWRDRCLPPSPAWAGACLLFLTNPGLIHLATSLGRRGESAHNPIKSRHSVFITSQQPRLVCQDGERQPQPWNDNGGSSPAGEIAGMPILSPGTPIVRPSVCPPTNPPWRGILVSLFPRTN